MSNPNQFFTPSHLGPPPRPVHGFQPSNSMKISDQDPKQSDSKKPKRFRGTHRDWVMSHFREDQKTLTRTCQVRKNDFEICGLSGFSIYASLNCLEKHLVQHGLIDTGGENRYPLRRPFPSNGQITQGQTDAEEPLLDSDSIMNTMMSENSWNVDSNNEKPTPRVVSRRWLIRTRRQRQGLVAPCGFRANPDDDEIQDQLLVEPEEEPEEDERSLILEEDCCSPTHETQTEGPLTVDEDLFFNEGNSVMNHIEEGDTQMEPLKSGRGGSFSMNPELEENRRIEPSKEENLVLEKIEHINTQVPATAPIPTTNSTTANKRKQEAGTNNFQPAKRAKFMGPKRPVKREDVVMIG